MVTWKTLLEHFFMSGPWAYFVAAEPVIRGDVMVLRGRQAQSMHDAFLARFCADKPVGWPWEHITQPLHSFPYAALPSDPLDLLESRLGDENLYLLLPEDHRQDIAAFGTGQRLVAALRDSPFMEFVIFPASLDWAVFDTHHNVLVIAGEPPTGLRFNS